MSNVYDYIIVGGGISGLSALERLRQKSSNILLLERASVVGGLIKGRVESGHMLETGPNAFLKSYQHTNRLIQSIGLQNEVISNSPHAYHRYIYKDGAIHAIPENPISFLKTPLFSTKAKLRLMLEPFIPRGKNSEESVYDFGHRRFGKEVTNLALDAMISGICTGDIQKLDINSLFPKLKEIEAKYRSLLLYMMKFKKSNAKNSSGNKKSIFSSLIHGMGSIADRINSRNSQHIKSNNQVISITKNSNIFEIKTEKNLYLCKNLVIATPAYEAANLLQNISSTISNELKKIIHPNIATLVVGAKKENVTHPLNGFGFLVPQNQKRLILGSLFSSSLFENRCPPNNIALKIYLGGVHQEDILRKTDQEIITLALNEVRPILGFKGRPDFIFLKRIDRAIPQFNLGHRGIMDTVNKELLQIPNLYLVGNYIHGVSVDAAIQSSEMLGPLPV